MGVFGQQGCGNQLNFNQGQMGFNPGFNQGQQQNQLLMQDERIWVTSQQAAESYIVAANNFIRLWDSSQPRFYEKAADFTGRPMAMKVYEYKEVSAMPEAQQGEYVSIKEFTDFKDQINEFINSLNAKEVKKNAKQSNGTNADA